ncbi:MAG TPA: SLC13 family permease [Nitrospirota bacterium]|nr:SLC13 family permease [Nitrospirota bacterium]
MPDINIVITLLIMLFAIILFSIEIVPIDIVSLLVVLALIFFNLLPPDQAFLGFSNSALIMIGSVLIMTTALVKSGVADRIAHFILRWSGHSPIRLLCMFLITVGIISSFVNNVAATAILLPSAVSIARIAKINPSKLLMPLAFGSMLGGTCTLIGTSTNIAVSGILPTYNLAPFSLFEFTPIGLIIFLSGILFFATIGYILLPVRDKEEVMEDFGIREYLSELIVMPSSALVGAKVSEEVFGNMQDLSIVGIFRKGINIYIPGDHFTIEAGDSLLVVGGIETLSRAGQTDGIEIKSGYKHIDKDLEPGDVRMAEAVIAADSLLEGKTLKDVNFRHTYGLSAIALYRHGICLREKVGRIPLRVGDVLLLQGERDRIDALGDLLKLIIIGDVTPERFRTKKAGIATIIFIASIIAGVSGIVPISVSFLTGAVLMVLSKCLYAEEVYKSVNWHLLILIGGMISLSIAVEQTGTAEFLADFITNATAGYGTYALLGSFFILTVILTQPMSNVAAALLVLPIAIHSAQNLGVNPRTFAMTITIAASCSFITPLEPASVLVYGPGRYRFVDFIRVGLPLTIVVFIISLIMIPVFWPL